MPINKTWGCAALQYVQYYLDLADMDLHDYDRLCGVMYVNHWDCDCAFIQHTMCWVIGFSVGQRNYFAQGLSVLVGSMFAGKC